MVVFRPDSARGIDPVRRHERDQHGARFHTGDLAIVRPAANYRVGEIVAYWSTLLHTVVLHRIIARHGDLYVFKGDNNHFIDPRDPTRSELLGKRGCTSLGEAC